MTVTFIYNFRFYGECQARRHINPDGSKGGIVAVTAKIGMGVYIGDEASIGNEARIGDDASIGNEAIIGNDARIGDKASIGNDASIGDKARIGNDASIGDAAIIGNDAYIGDKASIGNAAIIGNDAYIGNAASIGNDAYIGDEASIGNEARIGDKAIIHVDDWWQTVGPQGRRNQVLTVVHSHKHGLRWWVGCRHACTTEELREAVAFDHGESAHGDDYRWAIDSILRHPALVRRIKGGVSQ